MFSKLFELLVGARIVSLLHEDNLQFGFVSGKRYQKALFSMDSVVDYYTSRGSSIFVASLNANKRLIK